MKFSGIMNFECLSDYFKILLENCVFWPFSNFDGFHGLLEFFIDKRTEDTFLAGQNSHSLQISCESVEVNNRNCQKLTFF
jgi:hypothetical protein